MFTVNLCQCTSDLDFLQNENNYPQLFISYVCGDPKSSIIELEMNEEGSAQQQSTDMMAAKYCDNSGT